MQTENVKYLGRDETIGQENAIFSWPGVPARHLPSFVVIGSKALECIMDKRKGKQTDKLT